MRLTLYLARYLCQQQQKSFAKLLQKGRKHRRRRRNSAQSAKSKPAEEKEKISGDGMKEGDNNIFVGQTQWGPLPNISRLQSLKISRSTILCRSEMSINGFFGSKLMKMSDPGGWKRHSNGSNDIFSSLNLNLSQIKKISPNIFFFISFLNHEVSACLQKSLGELYTYYVVIVCQLRFLT